MLNCSLLASSSHVIVFFFPCTACWDVCISAIHCVWLGTNVSLPFLILSVISKVGQLKYMYFLHWQWERMLLCYVGKLWTLCVAGHGWQNCSTSLIILLYQQVQHILIWRREWKRIVLSLLFHTDIRHFKKQWKSAFLQVTKRYFTTWF